MCNSRLRSHKGLKKKVRRRFKAYNADGWSRKKAGSMSPQFHTSKYIYYEDIDNEKL